MFETILQKYDTYIWKPDLEQTSGARRWSMLTVRLVHVLIRDLQAGEITMRAMGLVYTTLLSLVPLLALAFSLLKAFGVDNALKPALENFLAPLGSQADAISDKVVGFVQNVQVGVLGAIGMVLLIYTVISLIQKIEAGCNRMWRIDRPRPLSRRFTEYISVLLVAPLVIVAATSVTATLASNTIVNQFSALPPVGTLINIGGHLTPYLLYIVGFTFMFAFMPNTHVNKGAALGGGLFAGLLWQTASFGFALFAANAGKYNAIYSGFAILILLLIWLYVAWLIMLCGCRVAFYLQHTEYLKRGPYPPSLGGAARDRLGLLIMALVGERFLRGERPWDIASLASYLRAASEHVTQIVDQLIAADFLVNDTSAGLVPKQDIARIKVNDILATTQTGAAEARAHPASTPVVEAVSCWLDRADRSRRQALADLSLREVVDISENRSSVPIKKTS